MSKNNFDGVRIGLALIVVFAHLFALTQLSVFAWFARVFDANFAVKGFFAISGFLVTRSYLSSSSLTTYFEKRVRRIYPAYLMAVVLCFFIGMSATTLSTAEFLQSAQTWSYVASNAVLLNFLQPTLPGVFDHHHVTAMNGSLWTIKIEVMLYCCLPLLVYFYTRIGALIVSSAAFVFSLVWVYYFTYRYGGTLGAEIARQFPGQLSYFVFGSLLAVNPLIYSKLKWIALASVIALLTIKHPYARLIIDPIAYTSIVLFLATSALPALNLGRFGDLSYGIYLYHFPIIQLLLHLGVFVTQPWLGLILTFAITIAIALLSWHLLEKRILKRNTHDAIAAHHGK